MVAVYERPDIGLYPQSAAPLPARVCGELNRAEHCRCYLAYGHSANGVGHMGYSRYTDAIFSWAH